MTVINIFSHFFPMPDQIIISVNPKAGRRSPMLRAEELQGRLREKGFKVELLTDLKEVAEKANRLHAEGRLRTLCGVGGDGTAATLVNLTEPGTPITLLPAGTANLLAKFFRLGGTPKRLAEIIEAGHSVTLDAGRASGRASEGAGERLFLVMVSCGFDADVVRQVHAHREERFQQGHKKGAHISQLSYIKPVCRSLKGYRYPTIDIERFDAESGEWKSVDDHARWAFFFNLNAYGWPGLSLAPFAKGDDGKLDHVLFRGGSIFHGIKYTAFAQCCGMHRILPDAKLGQSTKYRITSTEEVPYQLDGDPGGFLPLDVEVIPGRFTFVVPKRN